MSRSSRALVAVPVLAVLALAPAAAGSVEVEVTATDADGGSVADDFELAVVDPAAIDPTATLSVRVDDSYQLFVNGTPVLADDYWKDAERTSVEIAPGDVIALAAFNGGGPSGVFVDVAWADGRRVASSKAWQVTTLEPTGDWTAADFDDSGWRSATPYGAVDDPDFGLGELPAAGSPGQWIWSEGFTTDPETYFRFVVPEADDPVVASPLADRRATVGESVAFEVPTGTFDDPDSDAAPSLAAGLVDGGALPDWLAFDGRRFTGTPAAADAALLAPPSEPPKTDIVLDGLAPRIMFDPSMENAFPWLMAEPRISTACRDGRAPFPARVAMRWCWIEHGGRERGDLRRLLAFAGEGRAVGGGGLSVPITTRALDPQVVPLPAGAWLLATALGGLAAVRRARRGRSAAAAVDA